MKVVFYGYKHIHPKLSDIYALIRPIRSLGHRSFKILQTDCETVNIIAKDFFSAIHQLVSQAVVEQPSSAMEKWQI